MTFALAVLTHTPLYVWFVLAYLVWQGLAGLRPRTQSMARMVLLPLLFVAGGVLPLVLGAKARPDLALAWAAGAAALFPLGRLTGPRLLAVDRTAGTVTRPGSAVPLVRNVVVFVLQYVLALTVALGGGGWLAAVGRAVSGATAGYFAGWVLAAWRQYQTTPTATGAPR